MLRTRGFVLLPSDGWDDKEVRLWFPVDEDATLVRSTAFISELHPTSSDASPPWEDKEKTKRK